MLNNNQTGNRLPIDPYVLKHLDTYIKNHICDEDAEAFKNFVLSKLDEDLDHFINIRWSTLYGLFSLKIY